MSAALMLQQLAAARSLERIAAADAYRLARVARGVAPARSRSGWRHRIGWRLVEVGLRLAASDPAPHQVSC